MAYSEHFSASELACPCCYTNNCVAELLSAAEALRAAIGVAAGKELPVTVTSGYRCTKRNADVGGAKNSQHLLGRAMDIVVPGRSAAWLESVAITVPLIRGLGRDDYRGMLHIDVRTGEPARWCYSGKGQQVAYYPAKKAVSGNA